MLGRGCGWVYLWVQEVLFPQRIRSEVVVCEGGAGSDFGVRSVWEVVWVFKPARIVFGRLAKGVVAAGYPLLEPIAVGLADCHVVVVGAVVSVVSASQVVLGLAEAAASSAISLELEVSEAALEVSHFVGVGVCRGGLWCGVVSRAGYCLVLAGSLVVLIVFVRSKDTEVVAM